MGQESEGRGQSPGIRDLQAIEVPAFLGEQRCLGKSPIETTTFEVKENYLDVPGSS